MAKRNDTAPIEALRVLLQPMAMSLRPIDHQLNALPTDSDLEYYFVPAQHMSLFHPYYKPGQPYKNLKLVNYGRPAISLSFFIKHKYQIKRDVDPQLALTYLQQHRDELFNHSFFDQLSLTQQQELRHTDELMRAIRREPDEYQLSFSNYHHFYRYWYCSFRYFEDEARTQNATENEHLLKHTRRMEGRVSERLNIIFIDPHYITRPVPYDNKLIDRELETYPDRIEHERTALYIKKKP